MSAIPTATPRRVSPRPASFRFITRLALIVPLLSLSTAGVAKAQALADRVPADAVVYVGWQGAEGLGQSYKDSRLKAVIDATDAHELVTEFFPKLVAMASAQDPKAGDAVNLVTSLAQPMWQHPTAVFFGGIDWAGQHGPMPKFALICQAGAGAGDLQNKVQELLKSAPPDVRQMVKAERAGDLVSVSFGYHDLDKLLPGPGEQGKSLAGNPTFKSAMEQVGKDPAAVVYVDLERVLNLVNTAVDRQGSDVAKRNWPKVRDATGVAGLKQFAWASGFDGRDWSDRAFLSAPSRARGW